jgi:D-alanine-D-alanine ligase
LLADHVIPAPLDASITERMQQIALKVHMLLGCLSMSRTDMILAKNESIYVLEVNTLPGLLPASILPDECRQIGISYEQLIGMAVKSAFRRRPMEIPKKYENLPELPASNRPT